VRFSDTSSGNVRYRTWYFGDGDTSHGQNAVHTYREADTYTVRLVVSDGRGTDTEVKTDYITVTQPELHADFTADTTSGTAPLKVRFSDMSSGKVQFRIWSFGDGSSSFEKDPVHTYREAGIYTVRLTVYGKGDLDTETKTAYIRVSRPNSRNR
jgi:PKD repeat protein